MPAISLPAPELTDGVVALRSWADGDVGDVASACVDPDIQRFTTVPAGYTTEDARTFVAAAHERRLAGTGLDLAIVDADAPERLLGSIGIFTAGDRCMEIGYWIAPGARRRGIATRAVMLLSHWTLRELPVARISLLAFADNPGSQRVAERAGFSREGLLRSFLVAKHGRTDAVIFSLLPGDADA